MDYYEHLKRAGLYARTTSRSYIPDSLDLLEQKESFLGIPGAASYKLTWGVGNKQYECYVSQTEGAFVINTNNTFYFKIPKKVGTFLVELKKLFSNFTSESCERELRNFPYVWKFTKTRILDDFDWTVWEDYVCIQRNFGRNSFRSGKGLQVAKELAKEVDKLFSELEYFKFNINNLEKQQPLFNFDDITVPKWVQTAAFVGGVILIKIAVKSIGQDVDIDIPGSDDSDIDIDFDNSGDSGFGVSSDSDTDYSNVSFGHAPNDGSYTKSNIDVNIQVAGGGDKGSYDVYFHHGDKYIDFQDHWIKIQGKDRFFFNGNTYIIKNG